ncbi:MAG: hypothetical protein U0232_07165 [Thermomicrobiales bacterium]
MAPPGHESVYLLVPVPHLGGSPPVDWATYGDTFRDKIITYLEHDFGLPDFAASIQIEHRFTPLDFQRELGAHSSAPLADGANPSSNPPTSAPTTAPKTCAASTRRTAGTHPAPRLSPRHPPLRRNHQQTAGARPDGGK